MFAGPEKFETSFFRDFVFGFEFETLICGLRSFRIPIFGFRV